MSWIGSKAPWLSPNPWHPALLHPVQMRYPYNDALRCLCVGCKLVDVAPGREVL